MLAGSGAQLLGLGEALAQRHPQRLEIEARRAIALGHPLGATGAMLLGTVVDELERRDLRRGLVTLCVGGGMGIATIVERVTP